jgi:hypothetical protein
VLTGDRGTPSRPLAHPEVDKSEGFNGAVINTPNCNVLGWKAVQSGRQVSNISEQHTATIYEVNKSSAILNRQGAAFIEMLVFIYQTTRRHISQDNHVNIHRLDSTLDLYVSATKRVLGTLNHTAGLISRFRRYVDELCDLLRYYVALCGNCLPTFRDNVSVPSSRVQSPRRAQISYCRLRNSWLMSERNFFCNFRADFTFCFEFRFSGIQSKILHA